MDDNREWATLIETINIIKKTLKSFFIYKGMAVLRNFIKIIIKLGVTLAATYNK